MLNDFFVIKIIREYGGYLDIYLYISSLFAIICGILVLVSKNPIISILFLIGLFLSIAIYLLLVGTSFIGISYLVVYIGAVSILFLFILMLINIRVSELINDTRNSLMLAVITSILFISIIYQVIPSNFTSKSELDSSLYFDYINNPFSFERSTSLDNIVYYATSNEWETSLLENSNITSIGTIIYTSHSIWLIITSMILLLSMFGSISITLKPKSNIKIQPYRESRS